MGIGDTIIYDGEEQSTPKNIEFIFITNKNE